MATQHPLRAPGAPTDARPPFRFSAFTRVGFDETDAQAVVYYGRYFPYFDRARVEYLRHLDLLRHEAFGPIEFVMRRALCEYEAPARFDDLLEVFVRIAAIGRTSMRYEFEALHAASGQRLARAEQTVVLIERETRTPTPVPDSFRAAVERFEGRA